MKAAFDDESAALESQLLARDLGPSLRAAKLPYIQRVDDQALRGVLRDRNIIALVGNDHTVGRLLAPEDILTHETFGGVESLDPLGGPIVAIPDHPARPHVVVVAQRVRGAELAGTVLAPSLDHSRARHDAAALRGHAVAARQMPARVLVDRPQSLGHAPTPYDLPVICRRRPHPVPIAQAETAHDQAKPGRRGAPYELAMQLTRPVALAQIVELDAENDRDQP